MLTDHRSGATRLTLVYVIALGVLAALMRVAPRYLDLGPFVWNFMPIGALALFAGSRLRTRWAWLVPLALMLVADLLLIYPLAKLNPPQSPFSLIETPIIYGSFVLYVAVGRMIRRDELSPPVIGGAALLGSVQFFVLTNFATWVRVINSPPLPPEYAAFQYTPDLAGLGKCFLMGVPFFKNTLASDLACSALVFGAYALLTWVLARGKSPAVTEVSR
jgi:hypothetical protein